jgi:hypothetical protein
VTAQNTPFGPLQRSKLPQYGRSFTIPNGGPEQRQQLVRVQADRPQDMTIYLEGLYQLAGGFPGLIATHYAVTIGCGGIALVNEDMWIPAVGKAIHYTTDRVEVVGIINGNSGVADAGTIRIAAATSPGRPSTSYRLGDWIYSLPAGSPTLLPPNNALTKTPFLIGWGRINNAGYQFTRVPQWATRMRVQAQLDPGFTLADVQVFQVDAYGDTLPLALPLQHPTAPVTTLSDWTDFQELTPNALYIGFKATAGDVLGVGKVLVQFETYS